MKNLYVLIAILALAFIFGCTSQKEVEKTIEPIVREEPETQTEAPIYTCPLDKEKLDYSCKTDADCKMIACRGGAGVVYTCVGKASDYEGVVSDQCFCKEIGEYVKFENGTETTEKIYECRHK